METKHNTMEDTKREAPAKWNWEGKYQVSEVLARLGEALYKDRQCDVVDALIRAMTSCKKAIGALRPTPKLTTKESGWSSSIHTYLRKYCDDELTTCIYRVVADGTSDEVWISFIKELIATNFDKKKSLTNVEDNNLDRGTTDDLVLMYLLKTWSQEEFDAMIKQINCWK